MVYRRVACFLLGSAKLYYWELVGEINGRWGARRNGRRGEGNGRMHAPRRRKRDARKARASASGCMCVHAFPLGVVFACEDFMLACLVE